MDTAQAIATRITNDILAGNFDPSLDRYRLFSECEPQSQPLQQLLSIRDPFANLE